MNERQRRLTLNLLFALTMCSLFAALVYLIRSDHRGWGRATLELGSVLAFFIAFNLLWSAIIGKLRRKSKD